MKFKIFLSVIVIFSLLFSTSCSFDGQKKSEKTIFAMDAPIDFIVYSDNGQAAIEKAKTRITELENMLSNKSEENEIYKLNSSAGKDFISLSAETVEVLDLSLDFANKTDGAFNPALGPIINLWGIVSGKTDIPPDDTIKSELLKCNYNDLEKNETGQFCLKNQGMAIDLGGIGKGYAADETIKIFKNNGINSALVSMGASSIAVLGTKPDNTNWEIGIRDVDSAENYYYGVLSLKDKFISTSGDYERYFIKDGKRYHHIFDAKTGYPSDSGLRAVTVISDNGALGDVYSTALFVMGLEKGLEFQRQEGNFEAIFITNEKKVICTDGIKGGFKFTGEELGYKYEA